MGSYPSKEADVEPTPALQTGDILIACMYYCRQVLDEGRCRGSPYEESFLPGHAQAGLEVQVAQLSLRDQSPWPCTILEYEECRWSGSTDKTSYVLLSNLVNYTSAPITPCDEMAYFATR